MDRKTFELAPILDESTGKYALKNFDDAKAVVSDFVKDEVYSIKNIASDADFIDAKKTRTDIRKKKDAITQARIDINALLLGEFNAQLREIEWMLTDADAYLKEKVDGYATDIKGTVARPKLTTLVVKGYDAKAIAKVKAFATKLGLVADVKEGR